MIVFVLAGILALTPLDWFGWQFFLVVFLLILAGVLFGAAVYGLIQICWPSRSAGLTDDPNAAKFAASLLPPQLTLIPAFLSMILYILYERERLSALTAGLIAAAVLLLAATAAYASRRWQSRVLKARGRELLLEDPAEEPPPASIKQRTADPTRGSGLPPSRPPIRTHARPKV